MRPAIIIFAFIIACSAQNAELFETKVRPVLARDCYGCHAAEKQFAGLRVDSRDALLKGGKRGPAIVPGKPQDSLLIKAVQHQELKMPMGGKLKDSEVAALVEWVRNGAVWPAAIGAVKVDRYAEQVRQHWSFQPLTKQPVQPIDTYISLALKKAKLTLSPRADARILLRRLSLVLTGLPPTAAEIEQSQSYEQEVDRLLASQRFGEHWARYWLDVVRFGETRGYEWNYEILGAWRYRDYLIRAFNQDVPYDQLIREHVAGDLLPKPRINAVEQINESIIGTAFYRLGEAGHDDCIQFRELGTDVVDNQIDTLTKAFQGMTVSCARCHNHKLDPIPTEDYYGLYGILNSSRPVSQSIDTSTVNGDALLKLREVKQKIRQELSGLWKLDKKSLLALPKPTGMEDPSYPLFHFAELKLEQQYREEASSRKAFNKEHFQPFDGWTGNRSISANGDFAIAAYGDGAVKGIYPNGNFTFLDSERLNGAMRSPALPKNSKFVSLKLMGGRLGARRTIIDNCAIGENYKIIENDSLQWLKLETFAKQERLPIFIELVTRLFNPRIPDRPEMLKGEQLQWMENPRSYFGFTKAVLHDVDESPKEELGHMLVLFEHGQPRNREQMLDRYASHIQTVIERWTLEQSTEQDVTWLNWLLRSNLITNRKDATPTLAALIENYHRLEATLALPRVVDAMADAGPGHDTAVFISGDPKSFGALAPRGLLSRILNQSPINSQGSGRLELADRIASPQNPLTARLMVNRIWQQVFGRGITATVDNLGTLGDKPSHPELLDALATDFIRNGWSMKKLIRSMVMSETFRQSGGVSETDPQNILLSHYPLRRLTAESIRDSMLLAAGQLKEELYGPSVDPHREEAKEYRRLFTGPLDGNGRRSIYTKITRMEGAKFLETFDAPTPMTTRGTRDVTNVPAQALTMLNDPFVIAQADALARRVLLVPRDARITTLFRLALSRVPTAAEQERFTGLQAEMAALTAVNKDSEIVWQHLAHTILNSKEFLYFQ